MSVVSTYRKKNRKKKLQKALFLMQMIDTWQQFQELQVYPQYFRGSTNIFKNLLLHVKRLAVLSLHFKLHLIKKSETSTAFFLK